MTKSMEEQLRAIEEQQKRLNEKKRRVKQRMSEKARKARTHRLIENAAIYEKATGITAENEEDRARLSKTLEQPVQLADGTTVKLGALIARLYDQPEPPAQRAIQSATTAAQPAYEQPQSFTPNPQRTEHRTTTQRGIKWF